MPKIGFKPLVFPRDESSHDAVIEWWYFNGHLETSKKEKYAFMYCFFKADPKRVELPFFKKLPIQNVYFSHGFILNLENECFKPLVNLYSAIDSKSFNKKELFIKAGNDFIFENIGENKYRLKTAELDLILDSQKPPLLVNGSGWIDLKAKDTYYYSLSNLKAKGNIKINNKNLAVSGKVWLDRQWSDCGYHPEDKWTWFSIQLSNNLEVLCFEYGDKAKTKSATVCFPDGRQFSTSKIIFKPLNEKWESPETKAVYKLSWQIEIPEVGIKIKTAPENLNQEIIFGAINYWEGSLNVEAKIKGKKIKGRGFMELVGAPMRKNLAEIYFEKGKEFIRGKYFRP
jgi:predicted secreted hydrolase